MFKKYLSFNGGFTLIEVVAVIGVLAITSGILLVNTRTTEVQLNLTQDTANVASAINRAKTLTIQNLGEGVCGYGVHFAPGQDDGDGYHIFKIIEDEINGDCVPEYNNLSDISLGDTGDSKLDSELEFEGKGHDEIIRDIIFYSSDARVKLINTNDEEIDPTGIVIIKTKSTSPVSWTTLKINVTGQVSVVASEPGERDYSEINTIISDIVEDEDGDIADDDFYGDDYGSEIIDDDVCFSDCSCVIGLISGETCPDGCGGTCFAGQDPWDPPGEPICSYDGFSCDNATCADVDNCGAVCERCDPGYDCVGGAGAGICELCLVCGDQEYEEYGCYDNGCGGICAYCASGYECEEVDSPCVTQGQGLILTDVDPPSGFK
jgi:prepilin-type N-terminal cleavage/methylation domain-containing protein